MPSRTLTVEQLKDIEEKGKQGGGLRGSKKTTGEVKKYTREEAMKIIKDKEANIEDLINIFKQPIVQLKVRKKKSPFPSLTTRKEIISRIWQTNRHPIKKGVSSEEANKQLRKYLSDFEPIKTFLNKDENRYLVYTQQQKDKGEVPDVLSTKAILSTLGSTKVNTLFEKIKQDLGEVTTTGQIGQIAKEISDSKKKPTPSKKPTEPPVLSPTEQLDDEIKAKELSIQNLLGKIELSTDVEEESDMIDDLTKLSKELEKLKERKEEDSSPVGNVQTKVAEIEKKEKEKTEEDKKEEEREPPKEYMSTPPTSPRTATAAAPVQPPPVINPFTGKPFDVQPPPAAPPVAPAPTATATTTPKQDQEKGRPQDPTAIDTMQPLPSKSDLIPEARLGTKGKDINDLIDDIKYFMDNFEGQLKREKGFFKNVDIRNIKELRELHDRIVGKLAPEKQKSTDGNKVGIIVNADDYIREQMKKILQEQTFSSLRPADVVIDVGSRAVEGRDTKDFGDFEVKRTIDGGLSSQREAVYRYMPSENDRGEEVEEPLTRKKKSNRIKMPKPGLNNKRTTAIRMNTRNPFRGSPNTIKLKYLY